ncbi:sodium/glutamate symporter [Sansalvadorimonas verongulae]|uniref:sodium/glutamate symporter n=1 Tax=Sansalvadorimonas verongulae TaxID=2172824 RepID=UPI0018AD0F50|nr:sodium/glutamate symporter [Sansalvadorimonas verongulae]
MTVTISGLSLLILSIFVHYLGNFITRHIHALEEYNIPAPVTGGLLVSLLFTLLREQGWIQPVFELELRNLFLLMFFSTVGLSARLSLLMSGGRTFVILIGVMCVFLCLQNALGLGAALVLGETPDKGLLAGSVAFAGGHGTAITWGLHLEGEGYKNAQEFGLAAATLGLILGGVLGGPVAQRLIVKKRLYDNSTESPYVLEGQPLNEFSHVTIDRVIRVMLEIALTIAVGKLINEWLQKQHLVIPEYLPVLLVGVVIANITDVMKIRSDAGTLRIWSEVSMAICMAMSLMSLQLETLTQTASSLMVITVLQSIMIVIFGYHILFRLAGRDYDAAVITSGFIGSGLGATPVGMANVDTITQRFGMSPKAMLIIPLLGSFFTDVMNAMVLRTFLGLPVFH